MRHGSWELGVTGPISGQPSLLGQRMLFDDLNYRSTTPGVKLKYSDEKLYAILVRNQSGTTLSAGQACKWDIANEGPGRAVSGAGVGEDICGFVDPALATGVTVANEAYFLLIVAGPTWVQHTGNGVAIAIGDNLVGGLASGRVQKSLVVGGGGLLYSPTAISTAYTPGTTARGAFVGHSYTIPANSLKVGDEIIVEGFAKVTALNSTPTLVFDIAIGSVLVGATAATTLAVNDVVWMRVKVKVAAIGASGSVIANNCEVIGVPGTAVMRADYTAAQAIDTTAALVVAPYATFGTGHATNSVTSTDFTVYLNRTGGIAETVIGKALAAVTPATTAGELFRARVSCESLSRAA